jgi:hypothetical protein
VKATYYQAARPASEINVISGCGRRQHLEDMAGSPNDVNIIACQILPGTGSH